jgi:hypothetical protein
MWAGRVLNFGSCEYQTLQPAMYVFAGSNGTAAVVYLKTHR